MIDEFTSTVAGLSLNRREQRVVHAALLAQVDDVHVGGIYSLEGDEPDLAEGLFRRYDALATPAAAAIAMSLAYIAFDIDHAPLDESEWAAAEACLSELSQIFGR